MASVLQTLFSLSPFQDRYFTTAPKHWDTCLEPLPAACLDCQMHKIADGLLSGRYSHPRTFSSQAPLPAEAKAPDAESPTPVFQEGLRPALFKALIGKGHEEFATMRQQDSEEFLSHLLTTLRRHTQRTRPSVSAEPTEIFSFGMEQRLQCTECQGVRYRVDSQDVLSIPVPPREKGKDADGKLQYEDVLIGECLHAVTGPEALEYKCPRCQKQVVATRSVDAQPSAQESRSRLSQAVEVLHVPADSGPARQEVPACELGADQTR